MNFIDKNIDIFGTTWSILFQENIESEEEEGHLFGQTDYIKHTIKIGTKDPDGVVYRDEDIEKTIYHELVHAILAEGQYIEYSQDEPLVEWLAGCLRSLIKQKFFKDYEIKK